MPVEKPGYKHLETDAEFIARVRARFVWWWPWGLSGEGLDASVWEAFQMQRRLVEVFP